MTITIDSTSTNQRLLAYLKESLFPYWNREHQKHMNSDFQSYGGEFITTENITKRMKDFYLDIHQPFPLLENHTYQLVLAYVVDSPPKGILEDVVQLLKYMEMYYNIKVVLFGSYEKYRALASRYNMTFSYYVERSSSSLITLNSVMNYIQFSYKADYYGFCYNDILLSYSITEVLSLVTQLATKDPRYRHVFLTGRSRLYQYKTFVDHPLSAHEYKEFWSYVRMKQETKDRRVPEYFLVSKESIDFREIPDIIANRKNDIWIVLTFIREYSLDVLPIDISYAIPVAQFSKSFHRLYKEQAVNTQLMKRYANKTRSLEDIHTNNRQYIVKQK